MAALSKPLRENREKYKRRKVGLCERHFSR